MRKPTHLSHTYLVGNTKYLSLFQIGGSLFGACLTWRSGSFHSSETSVKAGCRALWIHERNLSVTYLSICFITLSFKREMSSMMSSHAPWPARANPLDFGKWWNGTNALLNKFCAYTWANSKCENPRCVLRILSKWISTLLPACCWAILIQDLVSSTAPSVWTVRREASSFLPIWKFVLYVLKVQSSDR